MRAGKLGMERPIILENMFPLCVSLGEGKHGEIAGAQYRRMDLMML